MEAAVRAVKQPASRVAPPLAVVSGAARALASASAPTERLRAVCEHLRTTLPAKEVRLRAAARDSTDLRPADAEARHGNLQVAIPWPGDRTAILEVLGATRPPAEVRPILETIASLLATVLPAILFPLLDEVPEDDAATVRRLHRLTIDSLPVGLYVIDRQYRVVLWNRKRETGTQGMRGDDVIGKPVFDVLKRQSPAVLKSEFDRVFATGEAHASEQDVHAGGEARTFRTSRLPMRLDGSAITHVISIGEDVTETRAIQRAMHQTEKLAAVGQLAAGVMHEINNPLATIGGCVAAIGSRLGPAAEPVIREYLDIIDSEVVRCTNIIDGLLDFSRAGRAGGGFEPTDVNALLERTLYLLKHHQRFRRLRIAREFAEDLPMVPGNSERLIQAAMAILLNAADATSGNGLVTLRTRVEAEQVIIDFEDDGPGIPADVLPKIFDPFFTTKGPARGTGLGLAICYGIVADHGGQLEVRSELGAGTVFRMTIPIGGAA
ncbi:MAG TPA: ATP-binding protein [Gemmatimonadales bacterium]|nr:ATP-binding protein [Gemmatimonadales bacterium]